MFMGIESKRKLYHEPLNFKILPGLSIFLGLKLNGDLNILEKPFDMLLYSVLDETAKDIAEKIPNFRLAYCHDNEILCVIDSIEENNEEFFDGKLQRALSVNAGMVSAMFYKNFINVILNYQDKLQEIIDSEELSDESLEKLNNRLSNLWKFLDSTPFFEAELFTVPVEKEIEILSESQEECISNSIRTLGNFILGEETCRDLNETAILVRLNNANIDVDEYILERYKLGAFVSKNESGQWQVQDAPKLLNDEGENYE